MRKTAIACFALAAVLTLIASCGGGGGGTNVIPQVIATPGAPNVEPIIVDTGPALLVGRAVNIPYVTIKICDPTNTACQTIDHIEVDTGSSGLRILSQALSINLPVATLGNKAIAECTQFADGSSFGPLAVVNLTMPVSGKTVTNLAIQVIGAPNYPTVPGDCPGTQENSVQTFGANGILGVGPFIQDCGSACSGAGIQGGFYYTCATPATCQGASIPLAQQVSNPVNFFGGDDNGVIVELPAAGSSASNTMSGSLVFGINTTSNNTFGSASVATADPDFGYVQATYSGNVYDNAALDSGSNAVYFPDDSITQCTTDVGLYCPASTLNLSATLKGQNSTMLTAPFSVANAETLLASNQSAAVVPNIGGIIPDSGGTNATIEFDLGLPFFYGRNVFTGMEGHTAGGYAGPFYGF